MNLSEVSPVGFKQFRVYYVSLKLGDLIAFS